MGSREVKLANEPSDRQLRALYIQFEHSLMLALVFPSDKEFRSILDASISIIHLRHVWKAVVWESPEIQFCKWPFPPSGAQTIKWGEIAKWFLCTDTLSRWNCTTPRGELFKLCNGSTFSAKWWQDEATENKMLLRCKTNLTWWSLISGDCWWWWLLIRWLHRW